jgi:hypothetical protein
MVQEFRADRCSQNSGDDETPTGRFGKEVSPSSLIPKEGEA